MAKRLLLIEDDPITNFLSEELLSEIPSIQYRIIDNAATALQYLEENRVTGQFPDLILVDLKMPVMDGFEFMQQYEHRFAAIFPATRLLALSSSVSEKDRIRAMSFPSVTEFLTKPLSGPVLETVIRKYDTLASSADQLK